MAAIKYERRKETSKIDEFIERQEIKIGIEERLKKSSTEVKRLWIEEEYKNESA